MHTIASQFLVVLHVLGQDLLMAAVTWSGDPEAGWQLSARVGEVSRPPLTGPVQVNSNPTTKGLAGQELLVRPANVLEPNGLASMCM